MTELQLAMVIDNSYAAVDACVSETIERFKLNNADGTPVPLYPRWRALNAGESEHKVTDQSNREIYRVIVRILPIPNEVVTVITAFTTHESIAAWFPHLFKGMQEAIKIHQDNLDQLRKQGLAPLPLPPIQATRPTPRPG